jgi:hypothetical protein
MKQRRDGSTSECKPLGQVILDNGTISKPYAAELTAWIIEA